MPLIELKAVYKSYQLHHQQCDVLKNINLKIKQGECVAIVGASGSGKTTLMNILGLLDRPSAGSYFLSGKNFEQLTDDQLASIRNQQIGFVFQSFCLLPRLTALENIMLPLLYNNIERKQAEQQAIQLLKKLDLTDFAKQKPTQLSGGQQQRIAIARALINNPSLILADEPTGALDSTTSESIINLFLELHQKMNNTILIVTHNKEIAQRCQRLITLNDGEIVDDQIR